jgi:hypothetical protein
MLAENVDVTMLGELKTVASLRWDPTARLCGHWLGGGV